MNFSSEFYVLILFHEQSVFNHLQCIALRTNNDFKTNFERIEACFSRSLRSCFLLLEQFIFSLQIRNKMFSNAYIVLRCKQTERRGNRIFVMNDRAIFSRSLRSRFLKLKLNLPTLVQYTRFIF